MAKQSIDQRDMRTTTCVTDGIDEILAAIVYTCIEIEEPVLCKSGILEPDRERSIKITQALQSTYDGPNGDLGVLDKLPTELVMQILSHLDLKSILEMRRVSRTAHRIVASSKAFKVLAAHATDLLWSLFQVRLAHKYSLDQIYKAVRETQCSICHSSCGIFLFIPLLKRTCSACRLQQRRFAVVRRKALITAASASPAYQDPSWSAVLEAINGLETFGATTFAMRWPDAPGETEDSMLLYSDALSFCKSTPSLRQTYDRMQTVIGYSQVMALTGSVEGLFVPVLPYDPIIDGVHALRACEECAHVFVEIVRGAIESTPDGWPFQVGVDSTEHRQRCIIAEQLRAQGNP